jgi:putative transposase
MVRLHAYIRKRRWKWPSKAAFDKHFLKHKDRYVGISSASIQQAVRKFFGNLATTRENRACGRHARYPWRTRRTYHTVVFRGNVVTREGDSLRLPVGKGDAILVPVASLPGDADIRKVELLYDEVLVTVRMAEGQPDQRTGQGTQAPGPVKSAAADPGQRWAQTVVTEDGAVLMVSGRGIVSEKARHQKRLAHLRAELAFCCKGSRRHRKLKRAIAREKAKYARRMRDANHKVTRAVADFLEEEGVEVLHQGHPGGIGQAPGRKAQRQRNGLWEYGEQERLLSYKAEGTVVEAVDERGSSSHCPRCGNRQKPNGRAFRCGHCNYAGHRDVTGALNILHGHVPHARPVETGRPKYLRAWEPPLRQGRRRFDHARSSDAGTVRVPACPPMPDGRDSRAGTEWLVPAHGDAGPRSGAPPPTGLLGATDSPARVCEEKEGEVRVDA